MKKKKRFAKKSKIFQVTSEKKTIIWHLWKVRSHNQVLSHKFHNNFFICNLSFLQEQSCLTFSWIFTVRTSQNSPRHNQTKCYAKNPYKWSLFVLSWSETYFHAISYESLSTLRCQREWKMFLSKKGWNLSKEMLKGSRGGVAKKSLNWVFLGSGTIRKFKWSPKSSQVTQSRIFKLYRSHCCSEASDLDDDDAKSIRTTDESKKWE